MSHFNKIDHLGIAVPDLQIAIQSYQNLLGAQMTHQEEVKDQKVMTAFFEVGDSHFELLGATDESSPIAKFLKKYPRGGLHHICVEVEDIEATLAIYKSQGVRLIDEIPRMGAHHKKIAFVHPAATHGVLLELSQSVSQSASQDQDDSSLVDQES
jgi:methylmalonyl-CoA/ethylmalonyl-CoA epimerase